MPIEMENLLKLVKEADINNIAQHLSVTPSEIKDELHLYLADILLVHHLNELTFEQYIALETMYRMQADNIRTKNVRVWK